jgi:Ferric reductase like transmembrane component
VRARAILSRRWTKLGLFLVCLVPFLKLAVGLVTGNLGINPVETLQHSTGDWTLRFLILTLCITPFRKLLHLPELIRFRRMLGLYAFFYVCLHLLTYLGPDQSFSLAGMWLDVAKRPFITVGFLAFVLLIPLAVTSTAGWIRKTGREGLGTITPTRLYGGDPWSNPLRLAGEVGQGQTPNLRRNSHRSPSLAAGQFYENPVSPAINRDSAGGGVSHPNWV